jgi:hypothetical protein
MSKPQVDLDGDEKLRDYGDDTPFYPFGESEADCELVSFLYHDGYKGKAYRAKVRVVKSDAPDTLKVGKVYCFHFKLEGTVDQKRAKMKELRSLVAAVMGEDPKDANFKANDAMSLLTEASTAEALEGYGLHVSSRDRPAVDTKTKEPIIDQKTGKQKIFTNRYFKPLEK